jgi:hypothetical protein
LPSKVTVGIVEEEPKVPTVLLTVFKVTVATPPVVVPVTSPAKVEDTEL